MEFKMKPLDLNNPAPYFYRCAELLENPDPAQYQDLHLYLREIGECIRNGNLHYKVTQDFLERMQRSTKTKRRVVARYTLYNADQKGKIFPYQIAQQAGKVTDKRYFPRFMTVAQDCARRNEKRAYVVNMPMVIGEDAVEMQRRINQVIDGIKDQVFALPTEAKERVVVVVGANRCKSLEKAKNLAFKDFIRDLPAFKSLTVKVVGFLWEPKWSRTELRTARVFYSVLKKLDSPLAEECLAACERPSSEIMRQRVPYQKIREVIKNSESTKSSVRMFRSICKTREVFLAQLDSDYLGIRGLFSRYDCMRGMTIATTGYAVREDEFPIIYHGVELDRKVREKMGGRAYIPEPNMIVKVLEGCETVTESFMGPNPKSANLESRHLIQHVIAERGLNPDEAIFFQAEGPLVTETPERFYADTNRRRITLKQMAQVSVLKALRGIPQSHLHSLHWAENLGATLTVSSATSRKYTSRVFKVYDPISLCIEKVFNHKVKRYKIKAHYDPVLTHYIEYRNIVDRAFERHDQADFIERIEGVEVAMEGQLNAVRESYRGMIDVGLPEEERALVIRVARASGEAIFHYLSR